MIKNYSTKCLKLVERDVRRSHGELLHEITYYNRYPLCINIIVIYNKSNGKGLRRFFDYNGNGICVCKRLLSHALITFANEFISLLINDMFYKYYLKY